jgi:hypothetical protein
MCSLLRSITIIKLLGPQKKIIFNIENNISNEPDLIMQYSIH